jgi:hypothetical protein
LGQPVDVDGAVVVVASELELELELEPDFEPDEFDDWPLFLPLRLPLFFPPFLPDADWLHVFWSALSARLPHGSYPTWA